MALIKDLIYQESFKGQPLMSSSLSFHCYSYHVISETVYSTFLVDISSKPALQPKYVTNLAFLQLNHTLSSAQAHSAWQSARLPARLISTSWSLWRERCEKCASR